MKAIRGATTVAADTPEEIRGAVSELLAEIKRCNKLDEDDIVCVLFSNTADIRSFYPAKAAREAGLSRTALYSSLEPEIEGALPLCIRVLLFAENCYSVRHVYLRGAAGLRRDLGKFAVAIDGPSGSGKSTVAKLLAKEYDILYLDTGAMYRACALAARGAGVTEFSEENVRPVMDTLDLKIVYENGTQHTILSGRDVSEEIRRPEVSMSASAISALGCVREKMVEMQRRIAQEQSCILDGRDIGTAVLPDAPFKFFVTASAEVRARRRCEELKAKGFSVDYAQVLKEIEERDKNDSTRRFSPLRRAEDAVYVDTSDMSIGEVVAEIKKEIQKKV